MDGVYEAHSVVHGIFTMLTNLIDNIKDTNTSFFKSVFVENLIGRESGTNKMIFHSLQVRMGSTAVGALLPAVRARIP